MSLQKLKNLSAIQQRRAAAILGGMVADAASAPLHWIYDQEKVAELIEKEGGHAAFYPTSQCPFYTIPVGNNSVYGDQLFVTLKNIASNKGFDAAKLANDIFARFGPGTEYENARTQSGSPVKGPWTNHCLKIMIANRENGQNPAADTGTKDPDGLCKALAIVGFLSGKDSLSEKVKECVETVQSNPLAIEFAQGGIVLLDKIIETGKDDFELNGQFTPNVQDAIKTALSESAPHVEAAKKFGISCAFPNSFMGAVHGIVTATGYANAVEGSIKAAGDNCFRSLLIGAYCGAKYGLDAIPEDWLQKYNQTEEVLSYIETIVQL